MDVQEFVGGVAQADHHAASGRTGVSLLGDAGICRSYFGLHRPGKSDVRASVRRCNALLRQDSERGSGVEMLEREFSAPGRDLTDINFCSASPVCVLCFTGVSIAEDVGQGCWGKEIHLLCYFCPVNSSSVEFLPERAEMGLDAVSGPAPK